MAARSFLSMWRRPTIVAPLIVTAILAIAVAMAVWHSVSANQGHLVFSLDDPYIHLAMARSLAQHGVWGVSPDSFSATSSAPLYTLLLALAFLVTGPTTIWAWGFCFGGSLIVAAMLAMRTAQCFPRAWMAVLIGLWIAVITGLPEMMFTGMEHALHMVAVVVLLIIAERRLSGGHRWERGDFLLAAVVLVACSLRYESLFLMPPLLWIYVRAGRRATALITLVVAVLPAVILGLVQLAHGSMILPNTILVKGVFYEHQSLWGYVKRFGRQIGLPYWITFLGMSCAAIFDTLRRGRDDDPRLLGLYMMAFATVCHCAFALVGRYVGYLLALGIWSLLPFVSEWVDRARAVVKSAGLAIAAAAFIVSVVVFPFAIRIYELGRLPTLGQDIYQQQYQMAQFFSQYYKGEKVALNDIGLVAWVGENKILDLWGLADARIARLRMYDEYNPEGMREIADQEGVRVAAVYPGWFITHGGLPDNWTPVGHWQVAMESRTSVGSPLVFFFATRPEWITPLRDNLQSFAPQLPPVVKSEF